MREDRHIIISEISILESKITKKTYRIKRIKRQEFQDLYKLNTSQYHYYKNYEKNKIKYRGEKKLYYRLKYNEKYRNCPTRILKDRIKSFFKGGEPTFTPEDIINKFGWETKCYLTGKNINLKNRHEYHFDHIIPLSKGGTCTLDNLGITTPIANYAKHTQTVEELIEFCKSVIENNQPNKH